MSFTGRVPGYTPWGRLGTTRPPRLDGQGGRTQRNSDAIHSATPTLLATHGFDLTLQEVADAANVSRRTIHRRRKGKASLVADSLDRHYRALRSEQTGSFEADLRAYMTALRDLGSRTIEITINGLAALEPDPTFVPSNCESWLRRENLLTGILEQARAKGEVGPGASGDILTPQLLPPIVVASSITRAPLTDQQIDALQAHVLDGARAVRDRDG